MKFILALCLFVGVAFGSSLHYYGWQPHKEFVFRYESSVNANIPEIRREQKAGLKLTSTVRIQTSHDYTLLVKFENTRFLTLNTNSQRQQSGQEEPIPEPMKSHLEKPFKVHMKRGIIEALFVEQDEPITVTNIKKALMANINLDVIASRRSAIDSNRLESQTQGHTVSPVGQSYFTVKEQSLHGDCETSYTIHPMTDAEAKEVEEKIEEEEKQRSTQEHLQGGLSQGRQVCRGQRYFQITKTRDFDNCVDRPVYQKWSGLRAKCDSTKSSCNNLMTHISATNYVVCGRDMTSFVIRKSVTENTILSNLAWNVKEKFFNKARVSLDLLREESSFSPMPQPQSTKQIKSLTFEYPEKSYSSSQPATLSEQQKQEEEQRTGLRPQLPKPDLTSRPQMLVPVRMDKDEITRQVTEELRKVAQDIFESPESCSSKGDVAGHLSIIAKALRPLSLDELKHVERSILNQQQPKIKTLFYDVVSMIGTNPAVMFVKEKLKQSSNGVQFGSQQNQHELSEYKRIKMLQSAMRSVKTPTKELLEQLVQLVKQNLRQNSQQERTLFTVSMNQLSNLLYRACVNPASRNTEYPTKIYGEFCRADSELITEQWIPFLEQELENTNSKHIKLSATSALGKIGHTQAVKVLAKIISPEQQQTQDPMVRSLAVYSLKKVAKLEPVVVRPLLLSIIDNPAESTQVRIAAVAVLPFSQPSTSELQKIAVRSWFEPSKQVASFIYSTFKSLEATEVPELKLVGQKVKPLIPLVKPFKYGYQYSKNWNTAKFVDYLKMAVSHKSEWTNTRNSFFTNRFSNTIRVYGGSYEVIGPSFTVYSQGMDKWMDQVLTLTHMIPRKSAQVAEGLRMITEKLRIEARKTKLPELFSQKRLLDFEYDMYLDEEKILQSFEKLAEMIESNSQNQEKHFDYASTFKALDVEGLGPCDAGFPVYVERNIPVVVAVKGSAQAEKEQDQYIPNELKTKLMPVINVKFEANLGVISPFTSEFIGTGIDMAMHLTLPMDISLKLKETNQVTLKMKVPEQINREFEIIHVYVKPYTVKKSLHKIQPVSKASDIKTILSGEPLKKMDKEIGQALELSAQLKYESDNKFVDLYSYWQKIQQHNYVSLVNSFYLVSSLRMSSTKILFNPQQSQTKELSLSFSLLSAHKNKQDNEISVSLPGSKLQVGESKSVRDMHLINEVCRSNFKNQPFLFDECVIELTALETVTEITEAICKTHPFRKCQDLINICEKARQICETKSGFTTDACTDNERMCVQRVVNIRMVHKTLTEMGNSGKVTAVQVVAGIKSRYGHKNVLVGASFGIKSNIVSNKVKFVSNMEVMTPQKPVYEIKFISDAQLPKVSNRWNKDQLIEETLQLLLNGRIEYGYEMSGAKQSVHVESKMVKSEKQEKSVRMSPEYRQCQREEEQNYHLSPVCEKIRHQAASIDRIEATLKFPRSVVEQSWFTKVGQAIKSYFMVQMTEEQSSEAPTDLQTLRLIANVSRVGEEAQLKSLYNGRRYVIKNIRLPSVAKGLVPISMRNEVSYNVLQKFTQNQVPSSCTVEPKVISTFDNKTYRYELNNCEHLLFKDCSNKFPIAVTAKSLSQNNPEEKKITILAGITKLQMQPKSGSSELKILADIDGQHKEINVAPNAMMEEKKNGQIVFQMKRYRDNVYLVILPRESLWVLFDGKRIEISASQLLRHKSCGLCGDLNGENTADLQTPRKCIMSKPRYAAYSYMIKDSSCSGIPSHDEPRYKEEIQECTREHVIPTPIKTLASKLTSKAQLKKSGTPVKPLISAHLVDQKSQAHGKTCISKQKIQLCAKSSQVEAGQPKPIEVRRKRVQYVCMESNTQYAKQMVQRAKSGETLDAELMTKPVSYSKTEYEPVKCQKSSSSHSGSYSL